MLLRRLRQIDSYGHVLQSQNDTWLPHASQLSKKKTQSTSFILGI